MRLISPGISYLHSTRKILEHLNWPGWEIPDHRASTRPSDCDVHIFDYLINVHRRPIENGFSPTMQVWNAESETRELRPGDIQLRLVSRAFNLAMTRVFFKYEAARIIAYQENALQRLEEHILHDGNRAWNIGDAVKKVEVVLGTGRHNAGSIFDQEHHDPDYAEGLEKGANALQNLFDKQALPRIVQRMPRLESLIVYLPEEWRSEDPWDVDEPHYDEDSDRSEYAPKYRLDLVQGLREQFASLFSAAAPLTPAPDPRFPPNPLQHLTYLRLSLPCAYDFAHIASHVPDAVASRLRHLYLEIIDGTGPGGDLAYTRAAHGDEDSDDEGDGEYLPSNLQAQFPNDESFPGMCALISQCTNLDSLGLVGTQCIDLANLTWRPSNGGLQNIYLSRVTCTSDTLLSLLSPTGEPDSSDAPPTPIEAFHIQDVRLWSGTWTSVFKRLLTAPKLVRFHVYNLVYHAEGESAHLGERNNRPWENVDVIWSLDDERPEIWDVVKKVVKAGGSVDSDLVELSAPGRSERDEVREMLTKK